MIIRTLARELYQTVKLLEELEKKLRDPILKHADKVRLEQEILTLRAERDRLRHMLDGAKEGP
jgi:hypothetical protein